jgi:hypothetical protein
MTRCGSPVWAAKRSPSSISTRVNRFHLATGRIERTLAFRLSLDETLDCGEDTGTPVNEDYHVPFKFTGELKQATINLKPAPSTASDEKKLEAARKLAAIQE